MQDVHGTTVTALQYRGHTQCSCCAGPAVTVSAGAGFDRWVVQALALLHQQVPMTGADRLCKSPLTVCKDCLAGWLSICSSGQLIPTVLCAGFEVSRSHQQLCCKCACCCFICACPHRCVFVPLACCCLQCRAVACRGVSRGACSGPGQLVVTQLQQLPHLHACVEDVNPVQP
jgi:hypothetical protein